MCPQPTDPGTADHDWSRWILPGFVVLLLLVFSTSYTGVIADGRDYYVQARSIVLDRDLDISADEIRMVGARGDARHYPVGTAILWAPFLAVCHVALGGLNLLGAGYARDGYDAPYLWTAGLATLFYGVLSLFLIARVLSDYFSRRLAVVTTVVLCAGSFLLWYIAVEAAASHGASLFAVTLFLYLWHRTRHGRSTREWLVLGAAGGLMAVVRWQDSLFALVLVPELVGAYWPVLRGRSSIPLARLLVQHGAAGVTAGLLVLPQVWLWHRNTVDTGGLAGGEYGVRWLRPDPAAVLFSPNHGLLSWTPLLYFALIGLVLFIRREPRVGGALAAGIAAQVYVNSSLVVWWGGSGFGARRFAGCALAFAIGLAALIDWCRTRPMALVGVALAAIVAVNAALMADVRAGRLPSGEGLTAGQLLSPLYERVGNPFSAPANLVFSWVFGASPARYDELGYRVYRDVNIDVGETDDAVLLTRGWSDRESDETMTFRWAVDGITEVVIPLRAADPYILTFRAEPFAPPGWSGRSVEVSMNGAVLSTVALAPNLQDYTVDVPASVLHRNLNLLRFHFSSSLSPKTAGLSEDARELTARFDHIAMTRQLPR